MLTYRWVQDNPADFLIFSTNSVPTSSVVQEIPENAADLAHLGHLHTPSITSGVDLRHINSKTWQFLRHDWKVRAWFQRAKAEIGLHSACYSLTKAELPTYY